MSGIGVTVDIAEVTNNGIQRTNPASPLWVGETLENVVDNLVVLFESGGADGLSAYEVAVANGFVGDEQDWLLSLEGGLVAATPSTGVVISFATPQIYNSPDTPATANVVDDLTDAIIGVVQKIYHNNSVAPTFPVGWVRLGTGDYLINTLNIIYCEWVSNTRVEYWVVQ